MADSKYVKNFIIHSPIPHCEVPECDAWTAMERGLRQNEDGVVIFEYTKNESFTSKQFLERTEKIAANLLAHGFNKENPFSIYMVNCAEVLFFTAAVWRLGGTVALINPLLSVKEINNNLNMLSSEFLLCDSLTVNNSIEASKNSDIKKLIMNGENDDCISTTLFYEYEKDISLPKLNIDPRQDVAVVQFSSGTTGLPKAVELTHRGIVAEYSLLTVPQTDFDDEYIVVYQPFSHIYGIMLCYVQLARARKVIPMPRFDLETYVKLSCKYKCTQLFFVPPIAVGFIKSNLAEKYDMSHIRSVFCGAAPLSQIVEDEVIRLIGKQCQMRQLYALTETNGGGTMAPSRAKFPDESCPSGSIGLPMCGMLAKVIDISTGKDLPPNKEGEILLKGDHMMKGYKNNPEATARTVNKEGWLHSGDIGYYNENGYIFVKDRLKELIKYKGHQVAPAELEALLLSHPDIADSGVTSIPDEESGELPHAWIVLKPSAKLTEDEVKDFVSANAAPYKKLRGGVKFVDKIPKSASGKILRREIKRIVLESRSQAK